MDKYSFKNIGMDVLLGGIFLYKILKKEND